MSTDATLRNHAVFIWSVADLLRGDYKPYECGKVILPIVVPKTVGEHFTPRGWKMPVQPLTRPLIAHV